MTPDARRPAVPSIEVRPFHRRDREQLTALVNAHIDVVLPGLTVRRALGGHATRFSAMLDGRVTGIFEVQADLTAGATLSRLAGWGDVWELHVEPGLRRRGVGRWLVGHGADWLRLARVDRLLDYVILGEDDEHLAFATALGFRELTRAERGWQRPVSAAP
jgi:GNAT superfamily N-acetyltransferase